MTIHVTPVLLASHFAVGFLHGSVWVYLKYKETGKFKSDQYTWTEAIAGFITAVCMGYAGIAMLIVVLATGLVIAVIQIIFLEILKK